MREKLCNKYKQERENKYILLNYFFIKFINKKLKCNT